MREIDVQKCLMPWRFHCCESHPVCSTVGDDRGRRRESDVERGNIIDMHGHVFVASIERMVAGRPERYAEISMLNSGMGAESVGHNNATMLPMARPKLTDIKARLADMDAMGVRLQVISPSPNQYYYWADRDLAATLVREQNEAIAKLRDRHPNRIRGLGNVALQAPDLAAAQMEYAVKQLGLTGVEISTNVNGIDLGSALFSPFWQKASELECVVFIHPFGSSFGSRLDRYYLANMIGQPIETTVALSDLIFSGMLDRYPHVKILAAHGGGYLPNYIGRSDHGYRVRPEAQKCAEAPKAYLKRIWFDSLVYDAQGLKHLVDRVGVGQVVVGTDYPFDMGHYHPGALIDSVESFTAADRYAIRRGNALALINDLSF